MTRRQFIGMVTAAGLLTACGDDDGGTDVVAVASTRSVRTDTGTVDVPAEPARVVATIGCLERLPDIDADWLVVPVGNDNSPRSLYDEIAATPLFRAIPAVQAGNVHLVDADLWPGLGHLWARALVDDLERLFLTA